jgi:hypothetical protein
VSLCIGIDPGMSCSFIRLWEELIQFGLNVVEQANHFIDSLVQVHHVQYNNGDQYPKLPIIHAHSTPCAAAIALGRETPDAGKSCVEDRLRHLSCLVDPGVIGWEAHKQGC